MTGPRITAYRNRNVSSNCMNRDGFTVNEDGNAGWFAAEALNVIGNSSGQFYASPIQSSPACPTSVNGSANYASLVAVSHHRAYLVVSGGVRMERPEIGAFGDDFNAGVCKLPAQLRSEGRTCTPMSGPPPPPPPPGPTQAPAAPTLL